MFVTEADALEAYLVEVDAMADLMVLAAGLGFEPEAASQAAEDVAAECEIPLLEAILRIEARFLVLERAGWNSRRNLQRLH